MIVLKENRVIEIGPFSKKFFDEQTSKMIKVYVVLLDYFDSKYEVMTFDVHIITPDDNSGNEESDEDPDN